MKVYLEKTTADLITTASNLININKSFDGKPCYLFCEDKITLNQELEIANRLGGFFGVEVLAFKRYVSLNVKTANLLSKEASSMVIRKIILELSNELRCFNPKSFSPNLAVTLYETISQLESAKVTPEILYSLINNGGGITVALKNKISDLYLIFKKYNEYLEANNLLDSNNYLSLLPDIISKDDALKGAQVILVGFNSITKQREDVIWALKGVTSNLSVIILADEKSEIYTNEALIKLKKLFNVEVIDATAKMNKESSFIKEHLFDVNVFSKNFKPLKTDKVAVFETDNVNDEVETLAKEVVSEVKKGKRYKNLAVAVGNLKEYAPTIKKVFNEYKIPYYIDTPVTLLEHPITNYILNFIDLTRRGFAVSDFLRFVSSTLFLTDKSLSDGLKNYVLKNSLSRGNLKAEFTVESENLKEYERLRKIIYSSFELLKSAKTVSEIIFAIKEMLNRTNAFINLERLGEFMLNLGEAKIADINDKISDKILKILNEMELIIGDAKISLLDFKNIFASGAMGTEISVIPLFNDAIFIGEHGDVKIKNADILYFIGLTSEVPRLKSDTALLSDTDLTRLDELKVIVEPKIKIVNERERENVGTALLAFKERLVLSYPKIKSSGENAMKSEVVEYLLKMFDLTANKSKNFNSITTSLNLKEQYLNGFSNENTSIKEILRLTSGTISEDALKRQIVSSFYKALEELELTSVKESADSFFINDKLEKRLTILNGEYFENKTTSASALEKYFNCPYSAFISNLLRLNDDITGDIKVYETGTLLHEVIELYVKNIDKVTGENSSNELVTQVLDEVLNREEYKKFLNKPQYLFKYSQIAKEGKRVCFKIYESFSSSLFKPYLTEVSFNDKSKFKAIKLNAKNGEYKLTGKIDRVDKYENNIRIIDYKTGKIDAKEEGFYTGRKLQLYLYLKPFMEEKYDIAGSYYFPVHDKFQKPEEKNYVMKGNTVDSEEILKASDVTLEPRKKSEFISIKLKKDGKPDAYSQTLSQVEMERYLDYAVKVSENAIDEMNGGFIKATPYENACTYCKYLGMCGFDSENDKTRKVSNVSKNTIIEAVNYECAKEGKNE